MTAESITERGQYLTFRLGEELFALDIVKVREVLDFTNATKVPQTPDYMRGVINLRGGVVPVVDLRIKFGMPVAETTVNTCVIIVEVDIGADRVIMGAIADAVQEVLDLEPDEIEPPPKIGAQLNTEFIRGIGKHSDRFIIILDIDKVFTTDELDAIEGEGASVVNG